MGGLSGLTSQPNFNSLAEVLKFNERENKTLDTKKLGEYSNYWEAVRSYYYPFESGLKAGSGDVYDHEIPGGQYSNLKGQAIALGLEDKFPEVTKMYGEVNEMFGDIIKVTPSSKVVGDMAQYMIGNDLTVDDVMERGETISFPQSVINFFKGDLGQPVGALACILVMIQLDFVAMIGAVVLLGLLFLFLKRKELTLESGDAWSGVWASLVKSGLTHLKKEKLHKRNWRPNIIMFSGNPHMRRHMVEIGEAISGRLGVLSAFELVKSDGDMLAKPHSNLLKEKNGLSYFQHKLHCRD